MTFILIMLWRISTEVKFLRLQRRKRLGLALPRVPADVIEFFKLIFWLSPIIKVMSIIYY